jgi:hypothetical protein
MESVERRDQLWPSSDESGVEFKQWTEDHQELWDKLLSFLESSNFTDYVQIY